MHLRSVAYKATALADYATPAIKMATTGGVEPPFADSESAVLPLDDVAIKWPR